MKEFYFPWPNMDRSFSLLSVITHKYRDKYKIFSHFNCTYCKTLKFREQKLVYPGEQPLLDFSGFKNPRITEIAEFAKFPSRENKVFYSS